MDSVVIGVWIQGSDVDLEVHRYSGENGNGILRFGCNYLTVG